MKIVVLQSNLVRALNQVAKIVGSRTTLPVLNNILLVAEKGKIKIAATDLEVAISTQTIGKIEEEGRITLPAKLLLDFVTNNKDESVEITTKEMAAGLKSSRFEATIQGISADEFPSVPPAPKEYLAIFKKSEMIESLKKVAIAPASDETRPVLAGIYFQFSGHELTLAATDSFRLAEKKIELKEEVKESKVIIPARTVNEVLRVASLSEGDEIALAVTENQASFKIGETYIVSRLIEGAFPNYSQIVPAAFKTETKIKVSDLTSAVRMTSLFSRDAANNNVKIAVGKDGLDISSAASQIGTAKSHVPAEVKGEGLEIAFNARYVLEVLNVVSDAEIMLNFNDSTSPAVVKLGSDPLYTYIIMPLKSEE